MFVYLVAGVEGLVRDAEVLLGAVVGQLGGVVGAAAHRPVPGPDHGAGHHQGDVVGVRPAGALDSDGHVGEGHVVVADSDVGAGVAALKRNKLFDKMLSLILLLL